MAAGEVRFAPRVDEISVSDPSDSNRITTGFNLALFAFSAALGFFHFLVGSEKAKGVPLEGIILSCSLDLMRFSVVLLITAFFVKTFWQRLISSVFTIRPISYQEAIAIVLMISVLFSG